MSAPGGRKLVLDDITDRRAYEREREAFRRHVIDVKKVRRLAVGPFVTLLFENRDTIRFQIQEMARVERIATDEAIENELAVYNPLIPEPGQLRATLFVELTSKAELETWLPQLVGIERSIELRIGEGADVVTATPDDEHEQQLTRRDVTPSVHYVGFTLTAVQVGRFASEPVWLAVAHPAYQHAVLIDDDARRSLLEDLRP